MILRAPLFALLSIVASMLHAHTIGESYLFLSSYDRSVDAEVQMRLPDVIKLAGLTNSQSAEARREQVEANIEKIKSIMLAGVRISAMGKAYPSTYDHHKIMNTPIGEFLRLSMKFQASGPIPDSLEVEYDLLFDTDPAHKAFVVIRYTENSGLTNYHSRVSVGFNASARSREVNLVSGFTWIVFKDYVISGTEHIIRGLDHLLFLMALILQAVVMRKDIQWQPVTGFKEAFLNIVKVVTLFTIAHSITLSLGVLGYADIPSRLTEGVIAASVAFIGLNILYPIVRERIWLLVFGFGLFHGLGFASNLEFLDVTKGAIFIPLAGFNLGVEIGQLAIILIVFPVLYLLSRRRFYTPFILKPSAIAITLISLLWLNERLFDINGLAPDELPISLFSAE